MELVSISMEDADRIAPLVAAFRVQLKAYKGIRSQANVEAGKEELLDFLSSDFFRALTLCAGIMILTRKLR